MGNSNSVKDMLGMQVTIMKGVVHNYEKEVIPSLRGNKTQKTTISVIEDLKNDIEASEKALRFNHDTDALTKHINDLKTYFALLRVL